MQTEYTTPPESLYEQCYRQIVRSLEKDDVQQEIIIHRDLSPFWISKGSGFNRENPDSFNLLIIDDHEVMYSTVSMILDEYNDFTCYYAESIEDMWSQLEANDIHIMLLDVHLPDGNGLLEVHRIRRKYPEVKIVPLTIEKDPDYVATHAFIGVDGWVPKGLEFRQSLLRVLHRMCQCVSSTGNRMLTFPAHIPGVEFVFYTIDRSLSRYAEKYLRAVINTVSLLPDQEARYQASQYLEVSPTSLKDYHKKDQLPSFTTLQRYLCASLAVVQIWRQPEYSLEQVSDMICRYCVRSIDRIVKQTFGMHLSQIRHLHSLRLLTSSSSIPIMISHCEEQGEAERPVSIILEL